MFLYLEKLTQELSGLRNGDWRRDYVGARVFGYLGNPLEKGL